MAASMISDSGLGAVMVERYGVPEAIETSNHVPVTSPAPVDHQMASH